MTIKITEIEGDKIHYIIRIKRDNGATIIAGTAEIGDEIPIEEYE